ncbi:hypothetical protein WA026_015636 [Henosepilachna vigintioctopunctata]|uniref:SCP domain-containing protein n=1 Tax=Henosepilachna vigintioctopunctata TaxID=420089 RepID=A0AAW1VEC2_9CUCU
MEILFTLCNIIVFVIAAGPKVDYCFVQCTNSYANVHLVCQRLHSCPKPKQCVEYQAKKSWRQHMLNLLNDVRNAAANGSAKLGFENTGAKNMNALSYDMELEYIVTCYINQCNVAFMLGCLDSVRFPAYDIFAGSRGLEFDNNLWNSLIWNSETTKYSFRQSHGAVVYEIRNNVWNTLYFWEVQYVGCAAAKKNGITWIQCLFGPMHYKVGGEVYKVAKHPGEIASQCEDGRNKRYPALCGKIDDVPSGEMWTHLKITPSSSNNICKINMILVIYSVLSTKYANK